MIEFNLKRIKGNRSVTYGRLSVPAINFNCYTLELQDCEQMGFKHNCCLPLGTYQLKSGFANMSPMFPIFRYHVKGFSKNPVIMLTGGNYRELQMGDIALGTSLVDQWTLSQPFDFVEKVKEAFRMVCAERDIMALTIWKSKNYAFEDTSFEATLAGIEGMNYFDEEDDDEKWFKQNALANHVATDENQQT